MRYVKPENAGKILAHHRYWTVPFLEFFLERCDQAAFDRPTDAYLLAQHVPELARRIRIGTEPGEHRTALGKISGIVLALAVKGSCCRANDELAEAELSFRRAFDGLAGRQASPLAMAELHRRYAALLTVEGEAEAAEEHLNHSLEYSSRTAYLAGEADALALRGFLRSERRPAEAVLDFIESARKADLKSDRGKRTAQASLQNLGFTVARGSVSLRDQETALRLLQRLKADLKGTPTSVRKMKALWIEGLILGNLQIDRHAVRQLERARRGLLALGEIGEYVLVSTDIYRLLKDWGEAERGRLVLEETETEVARADRRSDFLSLLRSYIDGAGDSDPEGCELRYLRQVVAVY